MVFAARVILVVAMVAGLTTCSSGDKAAQAPRQADLRIRDDVGGPPGEVVDGYPRRLTQGTWDSPIWGRNAPTHAVQRGQAAASVEESSERFRGWLGPLYIRPDTLHRNGDESLPTNADADLGCRPNELVPLSQADAEGSPYAIPIPSFLPPGTFEEMPPTGTSCNGTPVMLTRQMIVNDPSSAHIGIIRLIGVNVYDFSASAGRVRLGTVGGKDAVFISPLTPEGFGGCAVVIKEDFGVTKVGGDDIPFDIVVRVAEAV